MIGMQYKITLPNDYDMDIIRNRVTTNGYKTDGFEQLFFKAYLIADYSNKKQYAPLYLWKSSNGMNKFIFEGFFDNIINSFGYQNINIGIPYLVHIEKNIHEAKYLLEIKNNFFNDTQITIPSLTYPNENCLDKIIIYNPDKWIYTEFYFYKEFPENKKNLKSIYEILHMSV